MRNQPAAPASARTPYDDSFYLRQRDISYRSADCIVPLILSMVPARSVIDVGCGVGTWAAKFIECGVPKVLGIDGDYVNRTLLRIPPECFQAHDLARPIRLGLTFDLAICMEVAEHLPAGRAEGFVADLMQLAPRVVFSAAIPGQGGTNHINEQFLNYWVSEFAKQDCVMLDVIRPRIWNEDQTDWVYRQNAVLFARRTDPLVEKLSAPSGVDYIHPFLYNRLREEHERPMVGYLLRSLPGSVGRSLRTRLGRILRGNKRS